MSAYTQTWITRDADGNEQRETHIFAPRELGVRCNVCGAVRERVYIGATYELCETCANEPAPEPNAETDAPE